MINEFTANISARITARKRVNLQIKQTLTKFTEKSLPRNVPTVLSCLEHNASMQCNKALEMLVQDTDQPDSKCSHGLKATCQLPRNIINFNCFKKIVLIVR
jgi:hypothetical protein